MKYFMLLIYLFSLNCCLFYWKDGCFHSPQLVTCDEPRIAFSSIAYYQKNLSVGNTDIEQRWKDAFSCGSKYRDKHLSSIIYPVDHSLIFDKCMIQKGYVIFSSNECGLKSPKRMNKGLCNE